MTSSQTYATTHLYLFPIHPPKMDLYEIVLSARLASAGSATARLALYRIAQPLGVISRQPPVLGASPISVDPIVEFDVSYMEFNAFTTPQWSITPSITNTAGWSRILGKLDPTHYLEPDVAYMIGLAARQQTIELATPTDFPDMPAYRCSNQNPGPLAFPAAPSIDQFTKTPAITLLSVRGAATLGM